jgi:catechol 2,3-dioxygenase
MAAARRQVEMVTEPLELDRLMRELDTWPGEWTGIDPATDIGHIHLRVSNLQAAEEFYHGVLGFDVMQRDMVGALFLAAGGYHHHIGVNTWASLGAPRPPADAVGLISFGVLVPDAGTLREVTKRLGAAGSPATNQDDGSVRAAIPTASSSSSSSLALFHRNCASLACGVFAVEAIRFVW